MHTLENLLSGTQAPSSFVAGLAHMANCSPFSARLLAKDAQLLNDLLENHDKVYEITEMQQFLNATQIVDEISLKKALRQLRQRVLQRIIYRDLNGLADLNEVLASTSNLAEITLNTAVDYLQLWLAQKYGTPLSKTGEPQSLIVVGMGKLGGRELNVSSDIDLIFAYEHEGETNGAESIGNQDYFIHLAKKLISALDEVTEDGFVFRVDMRLRPFGAEGVLVSNLDALEEYYQNNGREWERYAWIKGRVVVGPQGSVEKLLRPFVFRKYLDYNALANMRDLKLQIHRDVMVKGQEDNIKLGRGGIREIEFIAQVFQLMRGGQDASLQIKPTLETLHLLKNKGLLSEKNASELIEAYVFLRNLEHRLMYLEDRQTQDLPKSDEAKARIANAMSFTHWDSFLNQLNQYRALVETSFDATFNDKKSPEQLDESDIQNAIWQGLLASEVSLKALSELGFKEPDQTLSRLQMLRSSNRYQQLPELSRQRLDRLMPIVIRQSSQEKNADTALLRTILLLESICRRASYLALFSEYPEALSLVIKLCAASPWLSQYLASQPIMLDELLDTQTLYSAPNFKKLKIELENKMVLLDGDAEAQMDAMRHFKNAAVLRFAAQDVAGLLPLETLSDYLSDLAQLILQVSLPTIWKSLKVKHCETPKFAVIAYGKLGGRELGYLSDLDIIFLYEDNHPAASENYGRFAQRINSWFNSITNAGILYETDLQLRPDGNSGLLVSSVDAFHEYQLHKAWVWEHQAITRARFAAGDAAIGEAFEKIRIEVITQKRDIEKLKAEIISMREKMRIAQRLNADTFDIKHSTGGIIDVEFIVQYLVLVFANRHPKLAGNIGNIALLKLLATLNIIRPRLSEGVIAAFREYRILQHGFKLQDSKQMRMEEKLVLTQAQAVRNLWKEVFSI
jgi:[glutamine synthetase] adenylyltransferase / [glutamine synthetase]-adenylyl-L-tyrosine phosphorylase